MLTVVSWNVNSLRLRLPLVRRLVDILPMDLLLLQETKVEDDLFPADALRDMGFVHIARCGQRAYNGVAILSRSAGFVREFTDSLEGEDQGQARHLAVLLENGVEAHVFYVPSGGYKPDPIKNPKFDHKLRYLNAMGRYLDERGRSGKPVIIGGDLNVAPHESDVWSHEKMVKVVSHTPVETNLLDRVRDGGGWRDQIRRQGDESRCFSWWTYRIPDWEARDYGRRLDHIWASQALADKEGESGVVREARGWPRPSDHVPVFARFHDL